MAQAVVSSYIHHNRHPKQNPLIPALAVSGFNGKVIAILYDCVNDVLFQIEPLTWLDMQNRQLLPHAVVLMWLILNHRLFLMTLSTDSISTLPKANLRCVFERANALAHYECLTDYAVHHWPERPWYQREEPVPIVWLGKKEKLLDKRQTQKFSKLTQRRLLTTRWRQKHRSNLKQREIVIWRWIEECRSKLPQRRRLTKRERQAHGHSSKLMQRRLTKRWREELRQKEDKKADEAQSVPSRSKR